MQYFINTFIASTVRLFKSYRVVSVLPATHRQYFILVLSLPFHWLRITFFLNTLIVLKELFLSPEKQPLTSL
jgi:hypothetical protein